MLRGKPFGNRPLERFKRKWEGDIRILFKEIGVNKWNLLDLVQDSDSWRELVNAALKSYN